LSTVIGIGGNIVEIINSISFIRLRSYIATRAIYKAVIYSISQKDRATTDYFLDFQIIEFSALTNTYPVIEWLVKESPVQSESE
jgi:hypothetical protein